MHELIKGYKNSCKLVKNRIGELSLERNELRKKGKQDLIEKLDLNRRIHLLYEEYEQMQEIIVHLTAYFAYIRKKHPEKE